jgi:hypothetical protein
MTSLLSTSEQCLMQLDTIQPMHHLPFNELREAARNSFFCPGFFQRDEE